MLMEGEGEGEGEAPSVSPYCPRRNPVEEHTLMLAEGLPGKRLPDTNSAASKLLDLSAMFSDQQSCHRLPDMFKEPSYWVHHGGEHDFLTLHQVPGSAPKLTDTYNGGSTEDYSVLREESESTAGIFSRNRRAPYPSPYDTEHDVTPSLQPYIMHSRFLQKKSSESSPRYNVIPCLGPCRKTTLHGTNSASQELLCYGLCCLVCFNNWVSWNIINSSAWKPSSKLQQALTGLRLKISYPCYRQLAVGFADCQLTTLKITAPLTRLFRNSLSAGDLGYHHFYRVL